MEFLIVTMNLYERLLKLVEFFEENSQTKFAKRIGISQTTFWGYLNHTGQSKIRLDLLNKILIVYPQINRDWLYFGEGEMLATDSAPTVTSQQPAVQSDEVTRLLAELEEERRLNRQLVTRLLVDGAGDKYASKNTAGKAADGQ